MKPREIVLEQIEHRETRPVPYSLGFEGDVAEQLGAYYGSTRWRDRLTPYMATVGGIDTVGQVRVVLDDENLPEILDRHRAPQLDAGAASVFFNANIGASAAGSELGRLVVDEADGGEVERVIIIRKKSGDGR